MLRVLSKSKLLTLVFYLYQMLCYPAIIYLPTHVKYVILGAVLPYLDQTVGYFFQFSTYLLTYVQNILYLFVWKVCIIYLFLYIRLIYPRQILPLARNWGRYAFFVERQRIDSLIDFRYGWVALKDKHSECKQRVIVMP